MLYLQIEAQRPKSQSSSATCIWSKAPIRAVLSLALILTAPLIPWLAEPLAAQPISPPVASDAGLTEWRWIGIKANSALPCPNPSVGTWQEEPLFPGTSSQLLEDFCLYTFLAASPVTIAELAPLQALVPGSLLEFQPDLMVVTPAGNTFAALQPYLENEFLGQAGNWRQTPESNPPYQTRLAVIDTAPTGLGQPQLMPSNSPHGKSLLEMAHRLLCLGEEKCATQLSARLALPYTTYHETNPHLNELNTVLGGFVGTISGLARAIDLEVEDWLIHQDSGRLVLNLSVAWDPRFGGDEDNLSDMPLPARAVYRALERASCAGVLTVAAAGNTTRGPYPTTGPMFPAAWEQRPAADRFACQVEHQVPMASSGSDDDSKDATAMALATYAPLVHAVAGVERTGDQLGNAREGSTSRLAAYGDHASVTSPFNQDPTPLLTGSSVAAVVVSAAAAKVWSYLPDLSAEQVMHHVYSGGHPLGRDAEFCLLEAPGVCAETASQPPVRWASVCTSLDSACSAVPGICPSFRCQGLPYPAQNPPLLTNNLVATVDANGIEEGYIGLTACGTQDVFYDPLAGQSQDPCPSLQYHGYMATPWVTPQPGSAPCPTCTFYRAQGRLHLQISTAFNGFLSQPAMTICDKTYTLMGLNLTPGVANIVENIDIGTCQRMRVSFVVGGNRSVSSQVLVLP